jgi:hypothetical protein
MNCRQALGQDFAMRTMRPENVIIHVEQISLTDRGRLLTDRQVRRPTMIVRNIAEMPLLLHRVKHFLERADDHHVALNPHQVRLRKCAG